MLGSPLVSQWSQPPQPPFLPGLPPPQPAGGGLARAGLWIALFLPLWLIMPVAMSTDACNGPTAGFSPCNEDLMGLSTMALVIGAPTAAIYGLRAGKVRAGDDPMTVRHKVRKTRWALLAALGLEIGSVAFVALLLSA